MKLLIRVQNQLVLKPIRRLSDGSYLAKIDPKPDDREKDRNGVVVRVIEYTLDDPQRTGHGEVHRRMTNLLDETPSPAFELIVLDHERWEEELVFDEQQTYGDRFVTNNDQPSSSKSSAEGTRPCWADFSRAFCRRRWATSSGTRTAIRRLGNRSLIPSRTGASTTPPTARVGRNSRRSSTWPCSCITVVPCCRREMSNARPASHRRKRACEKSPRSKISREPAWASCGAIGLWESRAWPTSISTGGSSPVGRFQPTGIFSAAQPLPPPCHHNRCRRSRGTPAAVRRTRGCWNCRP